MKLSDTPTKKDSDSFSIIDPSSVMVVGEVDDQGILQSPGSSSSVEKKKVTSEDKPKAHTSKPPKSGSEKPAKSSDTKSFRSAADTQIDDLDQKWSDRFNSLETLLLARTLDKPEPAFHLVKVTPTHTPPVGAVKATKLFIRPTD